MYVYQQRQTHICSHIASPDILQAKFATMLLATYLFF